MTTRTCVGCGGSFYCPPSRNYSFCTFDCKRRTRPERMGSWCVRCGEVFVRRNGQAARRYCSSACFDKGRAAATRAPFAVPDACPPGAAWVLMSNGKCALVDLEDFRAVSRYSWHERNGYAAATIGNRQTPMHVFLMGRHSGAVVDHVDRDRLNNRRLNLRLVSQQANVLNRGLQKNNTSGYRGVVRCGSRWKAQAGAGHGMKYLGLFRWPQEAALAYDAFMVKAFGEAAVLNCPDEG